MREQGIQSHFMDEIVERGLPAVVDDAIVRAGAGTKGVFLSIDIDVVDPGSAPGTGTPEPGGITPRELLDEVRRIARSVRILGADVVEVSPPYDHADVTAALANRGRTRDPPRHGRAAPHRVERNPLGSVPSGQPERADGSAFTPPPRLRRARPWPPGY